MAGKSKIHVDGGELRRLYVEEQLTTRQIAAITGISSKTITRRLHEFGIQPRAQGPERHEILRDASWVRDQYETQRKTCEQIAREIGASLGVVRSWVHRHGIETRAQGNPRGRVFSDEFRKSVSAAKKGKQTGEANPNWRGGLINPNQRLRVSHDSKEWSKAVRERDGHKCVECGAVGRLHAHHVRPWKHHPELRFDVDNGKTLCPPCHQIAHGWRFPAWAYHGETRTSAKGPATDQDIV